MELNDILYEKKDGIAIATFNRPAVLNAFQQATLHEFKSILDDVQADDTIRVLIITGNGRAFSAGIDLKEMANSSSDVRTLKQEYDELQAIQDVTRRMVHLSKIIIAAVNGIAVGIGVETALASDIRLAADNATFAFTEVKRALFETNGVTYVLPRLVGLGRAMQMLVTGEIVTAQDGLNAGLVTRVVAQKQLMEYAIDMAQTIAANAPLSVRLVKQTMQKTYDLDLEAMMQLEVDGMMQCSRSEDLIEGFNAFLEKRSPVYKGK
ncbi:MAG TPA: enoyl-CoA hydratase/isomerase family protein [Ktedonobacteraceae bacterium]|jgi:enoyl-CoA hydratase/carnithine racemase|nr:enoyl-CoA hydratase/isomerase family protein [Ktedonobacteraceae bacterium]